MPYLPTPSGKYVEVPEGMPDDEAEALARQKFPALFAKPPTLGGYITETAKAPIRGFVGSLASAARGIGSLLPEETETAFARGVKAAEEALSPKAAAGYEEAIPVKLGEALGSMASFAIPGGVAGAAGKALGMSQPAARLAAMTPLAAASGAGEARIRAEEAGATPEERRWATLAGVAPGALDVIPVERLLRIAPPEVLKTTLNYVKRALVTGGMEAGQEAAQNLAQNWIAKKIYKPDQELMEGVGEGAAYGGGAGALAQAFMDLALGRRGVVAARKEKERQDAAQKQAAVDAQQAQERYAGPVSQEAPIQRSLFEGEGARPAAIATEDSQRQWSINALTAQMQEADRAGDIAQRDQLAAQIQELQAPESTPADLLRRQQLLRTQFDELTAQARTARESGDMEGYQQIMGQRGKIKTALDGAIAEAEVAGVAPVDTNERIQALEKKRKGLRKQLEAKTKLGDEDAIKDTILPKLQEVEQELKALSSGTLLAGVPTLQESRIQRETEGLQEEQRQLKEGLTPPVLQGAETAALAEQQAELAKGIAQRNALAQRASAQEEYDIEEAAKRVAKLATEAPVETILSTASNRRLKETQANQQRIDTLKSDLNAGRVTQDVAALLGLPGTFDLSQPGQANRAMAMLRAQRESLERQRVTEFPNRELIRAGELTVDGKKLAALEATLNQISKLEEVGRKAQAEQNAEGIVDALVAQINKTTSQGLVNTARPTATLKLRGDLYGKRAERALFDFTDTIDTLRKGEVFGGTNPKMASSLQKTTFAKARELLDRYIANTVMEVAHGRFAATGAQLSEKEAVALAQQIETRLAPLLQKAVSPREKPSAMRDAVARAGLTPKEDALKRGVARSELADIQREMQGLRNAYTTSPPPKQVLRKEEKGEVEFALRGQTPKEIEIKQKREAEGFPVDEAAFSTLYKQMQAAEKRGDTKEASIIRNKIRSLQAQAAAEERSMPQAPAQVSEQQIDLIDGTIATEEKALAAAQQRLAEKRAKKRNLTGARREVRRRVDALIGLYQLSLEAKNRRVDTMVREAKETLALELDRAQQEQAAAKTAQEKETALQEKVDLQRTKKEALSLAEAVKRFRQVQWFSRTDPVDVAEQKLAALRAANKGLTGTEFSVGEGKEKNRVESTTDMAVWEAGKRGQERLGKAKDALQQALKLAAMKPVPRIVAERLQAQEEVARRDKQRQREKQQEAAAAAEKARKAAAAEKTRLEAAKQAGLKEAFTSAAQKDAEARVAALEKRLESKKLSKRGRDVLETKLVEAKSELQGRQDVDESERRQRQIEAAKEGQERRERQSEQAGRMAFQTLENKIKEAEERRAQGKLNPAEQAFEEKRAAVDKRLREVKEALGQEQTPEKLKALKQEAKSLAKRLRNMVSPLDQMKGQLGALGTLRAQAAKKKGKAVSDIAMKGSRVAPMDFRQQAALLEAQRPTLGGTLEVLRAEARDKATLRLVNEGLAFKEKVKGKDRLRVPAANIDEFNARRDQYTQEYYEQAVLARQKAMQAKEVEKLFDLRNTDDGVFALGPKVTKPVDPVEAQGVADAVKAALPSNVKMVYAPTLRDVPVRFMKAITNAKVDPDEVQGMVLSSGEVLVIGAHHNSVADLEKTFAHELIGHYSVDTILGPQRFKELVDRLYAHPDGLTHVARLADSLGVYGSVAEAEQALLRAGKSGDALRMGVVRELIAHAAEGRAVKRGAVDRLKDLWRNIIESVKSALERMGLASFANKDQREIQQLIRDAHNAFAKDRLGAYRNPNGEVAFARRSKGGAAELNAGIDAVLGGEQSPKTKNAVASNYGLKFATEFVDRYAPVEAVASRMEDAKAATQMMHDLRMADQRMSFVSAVASTGPLVRTKMTDPKSGQAFYVYDVKDGANLKQVASLVGKLDFNGSNAAYNERVFTTYMAMRRAEEVGYPKLNLDVDKQSAIRDFKRLIQKPEYAGNLAILEQAREVYNEYNRGLITFVEQSGAISTEEANRLRGQKDYIPYYRADAQGNVTLDIGGETPFRVGDLKTQPELQQLLGDNTSILPVFDSAILNTNMLISMGLRNQAVRNLAFTFEGLDIGQLRDGRGPASNDVLRFKLNGEDKHLIVKTKDTVFEDISPELLVKGMEGVATLVPWYVNLLSKPAKLLRKMITLSPTYAVNQIIKDSVAMNFTTGANGIPVLSALNEVRRMYSGTSAGEDKLRRSGVMSSKILTGTSEDFSTILRQISEGGGFSPIATMEAFGMKADAASRVVLYNSFLSQGLNEIEARLAALEAVNFTKRGTSPGMYHLNLMVPFLNANIQGLNVLFKAFKGTMPFNERLKVRQKLYTRGLMLAGSTMLYAATLAGEDWYEELSDEDRLKYWFVKVPGVEEPLRIPIPFEVGLLFKAVPEAAMRMAKEDAKAAPVVKALGSVFASSLPMMPLNMVPAGVKPLAELWANKSTFSAQAIESKREQALDPSERFRDNTTELAKLLGSFGLVSPVQVDHLVRGYTAGLGLEAVALLNPALRGFAPKATGEEPEKLPSQIPVLRAFFQPMDARGMVDRVYDFMAEADRKQDTFKKLVEEGRDDEALSYMEKYIEEISYGRSAERFRKQMSFLIEAERLVKRDPTMTGLEKRERLQELRDAKRNTAKAYAIGGV